MHDEFSPYQGVRRSAKEVAMSFGRGWQRNASALVWTPVLLLGPLLSLHGGAGAIALQLGLIALMAGATVVAVLTSRPAGQSATPYVALGVLAAATIVGANQGSEWLPTWVLLAITLPSVLRGLGLLVAIPIVAAGSMVAAWLAEDASGDRVWTEGFVVLLAGVAATAVTRLIDTIDELRRTRRELARRAVEEERERFSRDLHDLLGHTLSVIVVKAQAARRLAESNPRVAAEHAADIERVGREALVQVREAVDAMRTVTLEEELEGARRALDAAGIQAEVSTYEGPILAEADQALAWVVRESATNVMRHSGAGHCLIEVKPVDGQLVLTVADDGVGAAMPERREGGLEGLRRRLDAVGGRLDVEPDADGFRLTARVPQPQGQR
jgi:two-component system, NarL family, sensor histidine kinase DesK